MKNYPTLSDSKPPLKKHIGKPARLVKLSFVEKKGNNTVTKVIFSIIFVKIQVSSSFRSILTYAENKWLHTYMKNIFIVI